MLWRLFTLFVTVFWLVMTLLLVRVTEGSQFAKVPPGAIFKMFLARGATTNQFMLYHGDKKVGHGILTPRRVAKPGGPADYEMMMSGMLDRGAQDLVDSEVSWRVNLFLHAAERWGGVNGALRMPQAGVSLDFNWAEEDTLPKFSLHTKSGDMDDRMLRLMMPFMTNGNGEIKPPPGMQLPAGVKLPAAGAEGTVQVRAREGVMVLAGQKRRGYVMELVIMDQQRAKAFFTEAGELAMVEMPDGWRALDPVIYNLVPEIPDPEE
jgi:hypothetical protein